MVQKITTLDQELFVFLNGLGSETFDGFWLILTKQINWIPLFLLMFYLVYKKTGIKHTLILALFVTVLLTCSDQITNLFKYSFQRLRPCNNPELSNLIRAVHKQSSFGFFSGHAANTTAVATFLYLIIKRHYKYFGFLFLWPLIFAYSRIYLGLHYPLDILAGYLFGMIIGYLFFRLYQIVQLKYFAGLA